MPESDDLRTFIRDLMTRFDRKMDRIDATMERQAAESRAYFERIDRKLDDQLAESRAHREALLHILDELRGKGGPATAG
jgi:hypothetical protein